MASLSKRLFRLKVMVCSHPKRNLMVGQLRSWGFAQGRCSLGRALIAVLAPADRRDIWVVCVIRQATSFAAPLGIGILLGVAGDRWAYGIMWCSYWPDWRY